MKTSILITVLTISVLLFAGCATDTQQAPGKGGALTQLDVFRDGNKPSRPYKEIRLLTDEGKAVEQVAIEDKMRKKAQALGGAGIIFFSREETGAEMSGLFGVSKTFLYKASVIVYSQ
jgi:hypothetical protein